MNNPSQYLLLLWLAIPVAALAAPLNVFVTVPPLKTFVKTIGGEKIRVSSMIKPGQNPHTFSPTPQQITALANASLYLKSSDLFERAWMSRIRSVNPGMKVVEINPAPNALESDDGQDHHHESDPHFWTNPKTAIAMADAIGNALIAIDPAHADLYKENLNQFTTTLSSVDDQIRHKLRGLKKTTFLVVHPAWSHFANAYNLTQVAIEHEGKPPGGRAMAALIELAKREEISVIITQPQFSQQSAKQLADAIDGEIVTVDPLSLEFQKTLLKMADLIARGAK